MQITQLQPNNVFYYFSEISKIPHGSGNTKALADYCINFAEKRGLKSFRDAYGNVILFKDGTSGYEQSEPIILQGHLDMVCEKEPGCLRNMEQEGIALVTDGNYVWADGTTLGGDDGIAVAYMLALLDADDVPHPPIEALFTNDEETGLRGANALDASQLKGRRLINIDSEEEGILTVSCAGGVRVHCDLPITMTKPNSDAVCAQRIKIGGLLGGHSGVDIGKCRQNAAKLLAELLYMLSCQTEIYIANVQSGGRVNVIPAAAEAVVCFHKEAEVRVCEQISRFNLELKKRCEAVEKDAFAERENAEVPAFYADKQSTQRMIFMLMQSPCGVYAMNPRIPGLVQTSLNLGSVTMENGLFTVGFMIRSNVALEKQTLVNQLKSLTAYIGSTIRLEDDYPAWEYQQKSPLRDTMAEVYEEMYGKAPEICAIHAGLECGILLEKLGEADMVSFGPDMENVHTPGERIRVDSVARCWQYLLRVLERLK